MNTCQKCSEPANNVTMTLCNAHIDELRKNELARHTARIAAIKLEYPYYIPDYTDVGEGDRRYFTSFQVTDAKAKTVNDFLENIIISEIDQDGGEVDCITFDDAPLLVQAAILRLAGLTWQEVAAAV